VIPPEPFYPDTNALISTSVDLFDLVSRDDIGDLLKELNYDWMHNTMNQDAEVVPILKSYGFVESDDRQIRLNRLGLLFLGRLLLHFDVEHSGSEVFGNLTDKYNDFVTISSSKNSIVVRARHRILETEFILKLVRPGASFEIENSIKRLSKLGDNTAVLLPIDFIKVTTNDILGKSVSEELRLR
jgi:hypothetical protein